MNKTASNKEILPVFSRSICNAIFRWRSTVRLDIPSLEAISSLDNPLQTTHDKHCTTLRRHIIHLFHHQFFNM